MNKALVILAAGLGTRFKGGIKQLSPVGPCGELIIEYSVFDAIKAGCNKVIFIIRREIEQAVRETVGARLEKYVSVEYCFQDLCDIPFSGDISGRIKPWGTVHAVLAARKLISEPFVIINADDYYGRDSFEKLFGALSENNDPHQLYMSGFILKNTLSDSGTVTRGICSTDDRGELVSVTETYKLSRNRNGNIIGERDGVPFTADPSSIVSMNIWGCTPETIDAFEDNFRQFLIKAQAEGSILTAEYPLPMAIDTMIKSGKYRVKVIPTDGVWLGITRSEDCEGVCESIHRKVLDGEYVSPIFR